MTLHLGQPVFQGVAAGGGGQQEKQDLSCISAMGVQEMGWVGFGHDGDRIPSHE